MERLQATLAMLAEKNVHLLVADDIEFMAPDYPIDGNKTWREKKKEFLAEIDGWMKEAKSERELLGLQIAYTEVEDFNAKETMMYELHRKLEDVVEWRFGTSDLGDGYYDNPGVLEIRMQASDPLTYINNYHRIIHTLGELAQEYHLGEGPVVDGLDYSFKVSYPHTHLSVWQSETPPVAPGESIDIRLVDGMKLSEFGRNMTMPLPGQENDDILAMVGSIAQAFHDGGIMVSKTDAFLNQPHKFNEYTVGPSRTDHIRYINSDNDAKAHLEYRTAKQGVFAHKSLLLLTLAAGVSHALAGGEISEAYSDLELVEKPVLTMPPEDLDREFRRLFGVFKEGVLQEDGTIGQLREYAATYYDDIAFDMNQEFVTNQTFHELMDAVYNNVRIGENGQFEIIDREKLENSSFAEAADKLEKIKLEGTMLAPTSNTGKDKIPTGKTWGEYLAETAPESELLRATFGEDLLQALVAISKEHYEEMKAFVKEAKKDDDDTPGDRNRPIQRFAARHHDTNVDGPDGASV